jgi:hypothetical protein
MTTRVLTIAIGAIFLSLLHAQPGRTQSSEELKALKKDIEGLKQGQPAIQRELQEIKT